MKKHFSSFSEAVLLELSREGSYRLVAESSLAGSLLLGLRNVELLSLLLSLLLEGIDEGSLGPAALGGKIAEGAELSVGLQSEHLKSFGDDDSLLVIVGEWNTFENLEAAESSGALGSLVGQHAAGGLPEES